MAEKLEICVTCLPHGLGIAHSYCAVQSKRELRCAGTIEDGVAIYARLVQLYSDPPNNFVRAVRPYPAGIGSAKFQKV